MEVLERLGEIHMDSGGSFDIPSINGAKSYMLLTDQATLLNLKYLDPLVNNASKDAAEEQYLTLTQDAERIRQRLQQMEFSLSQPLSKIPVCQMTHLSACERGCRHVAFCSLHIQ